MNCFFCNLPLEDSYQQHGTYFKCLHCPYHIRYDCSAPCSNNGNVLFVHAETPMYLVEWNMQFDEVKVYVMVGPSLSKYNPVLKLLHGLPFEIDKLTKLFERLDKIKAFL